MKTIYWLYAYLGLMTFAGAITLGFHYDPMAPVDNFWFNIGLYMAFAVVHMVMMRPWFKKAVYGSPQGTLGERQVYIFVTIVTWVAVYYFHKPVAGFMIDLPEWTQLLGIAVLFLGVFAFFETANFDMMNGFLGVPGSVMSHSTGSETPLMTQGSYASVRHPMYRGVMIIGIGSMIMHPHASQLLWVAMVGLTFIAFVPVEEKALLAARGEEYRAYMQRTPYRIFKGIW